MTIDLRPEDRALVEKRLQSGSFASLEEVIHDALAAQDSEALWLTENRDRINEKIRVGLAQLDRGECDSGETVRARLQARKTAWLAEFSDR